ncbi:hypothetical protein [Undibacterium pigrum]|uniref:Lipoprotein n=1 Tax=Undibacterium pigrum TaxID=401470 RepID=A0A318J3W0_9BURK|nr:hypothetical protein [Undibacterium pigrum]PXX41380.1 hypothetical protein DFR42_10731 [Undibacterium pigrum]
MRHFMCYPIVLSAILFLSTGCTVTGKGLDPGPASAARIGMETKEGVARDYPVNLSTLILLSVHGDKRKVNDTAASMRAEMQADLVAIKTLPSVSTQEIDAAQSEIEYARKYFYDHCPSNDRCGVLRDRVQDRLIWASESACTDYMSSVRKSFTRTNLNLGAATTVFGTLGSLVTSINTARVFSGAGAISSGLRAEYNDVYFASQAFELVSKAIRATREKALKRIHDNRQAKGIKEYTLEGAIADTMTYHSYCNVMAGLEEAADAVTRERDPGLKRINELLQGANTGATFSLGTATIDTSGLPSAANSCRLLTTLAQDSKKVVDEYTANNKKLLADSTADAAAKKESAAHLDKIKKLDEEIQQLFANAKGDCNLKDGVVDKKEAAMFDAIRKFSSVALSEKAAEKLRFQSAKEEVSKLQSKIDDILSRARSKLEELVALAKTTAT